MATAPIITCYSRTGNTRAIAAVIADEVHGRVAPLPEAAATAAGCPLLFVGSPVNCGRPFPQLIRWLETLPALPGTRFAVFATMAFFGGRRTCRVIRAVLTAKGGVFLDSFVTVGACGPFGGYGPKILRARRPNEHDRASARAWARRVISLA